MPLDGFGIFGVVKEVGVDDEGTYVIYYCFPFFLIIENSPLMIWLYTGLVEFQSNFFPYPLYRDEL